MGCLRSRGRHVQPRSRQKDGQEEKRSGGFAKGDQGGAAREQERKPHGAGPIEELARSDFRVRKLFHENGPPSLGHGRRRPADRTVQCERDERRRAQEVARREPLTDEDDDSADCEHGDPARPHQKRVWPHANLHCAPLQEHQDGDQEERPGNRAFVGCAQRTKARRRGRIRRGHRQIDCSKGHIESQRPGGRARQMNSPPLDDGSFGALLDLEVDTGWSVVQVRWNR